VTLLGRESNWVRRALPAWRRAPRARRP